MWLPQLCGCLCFSMRFVVFLDLIGTVVLPVTICYLGYLIFLLIMDPSANYAFYSLLALGGTYALQALVFMMRLKFDMLIWMLIYIVSQRHIVPCFALAMIVFFFMSESDDVDCHANLWILFAALLLLAL